MMRRLWIAACVLVPLLVLSVPTAAIVGIWSGSGRLLLISGVLLFASLPTVPMFWIWTADNQPQPNLPRRQQMAVRAERDRIRMEAAIAEAEREAGIR